MQECGLHRGERSGRSTVTPARSRSAQSGADPPEGTAKAQEGEPAKDACLDVLELPEASAGWYTTLSTTPWSTRQALLTAIPASRWWSATRSSVVPASATKPPVSRSGPPQRRQTP